MNIEHIAMWTNDIERLKNFYAKYFGASSNTKYTNTKKQFESYFLSFSKGCRLEIMQIPEIMAKENDAVRFIGLSHFAISVGSKEDVISLTNRIKEDGYKILSEPRTTGDGYFESVVCDPDGNSVEITL